MSDLSGKPALTPHPGPTPLAGEGARLRSGERRLLSPQAGKGRDGGLADPTDIHIGDWVDRWLPRWAEPYARLARLDRPIGTWLLLFPGWWGVALAAQSWPDWRLLVLFGIGAVAMRGAGCTLNDIADRDYDGKVERTRLRPIPSGAVSLRQAVIFMALELGIGAAVLACLTPAAMV